MGTERTTSLAALLSGAVARWPDRVAITAPGGPDVTYSELEDGVARAGAALRSLGIERGDRVAIALRDGLALAQAFLGVASHAVAAPLNPASTHVELERSLQDLGPRLLLAEPASPAAEVARRLGIRVVEALALAEAPAAGSAEAMPHDVALVLSTSGTTSRPKLVPLTHANLCSSAANVARRLELTDGDRCLSIMPLFHIHGLVAGLLAPLAAGGTVVRTPPFDARAMLGWLDELRPTWYTAVPAMHQALLAVAGEAPRRTSLRLIRSSSASLPNTVAAELERLFGVPVIESYGMTEAAHQVASNPLPPSVRKLGTVGPAAGPELAIVADDGRFLGPGERGEIVIRGDNVISGYAGDPVDDETAFIAGGWLRTGDEGLLDDDGYLRICGRLKEMINRGGEKVSPLEIDEALVEHPAVVQAVTFGVEHPRLGEDVAAAIVLRPDACVSVSELRTFAAKRLAPSKVPHRIVIIDTLPRTPTGKVQRIGLADALGLTAGMSRAEGKGVPGSPRTPLEGELADRWAAVLDAGAVDVDEDFFELGGDSLAAAELLAFVEGTYGVQLPLASLLGNAATVAGMAHLIEEQRAWSRAEQAGAPELEILHVHRTGALSPLFFIDPTLAVLRRLTQLADADQSIAELVMPASDDFAAFTRLEDMAAHYASVIRSAQPDGPYFVCGHSFAGLVAFEVARQLARQGERIGRLLMLDTVCPTVRDRKPSLSMRHDLRRARRLAHDRIAYLRSVREDPRAGLAAPQSPRVAMATRYVARRLTAPVTLLYTRRNAEELGDPALGWAEFVTQLELREVPGDHRSMLQEPHVLELAAAIMTCLARARTQGSTGGNPSRTLR